jgi:aminoglycoside 2''-phosphotransferase
MFPPAYLDSIRQANPGFEICTAVLNPQGQNSDVLIVNDRWVFRFPKYEHELHDFRVEIAILAALQGHLPLEIPSPRFVQLEDRPLGRAFVGYALIPGEPLRREILLRLQDEAIHDALAEQLAGFLLALHAFTDKESIPYPLKRMDTRAEWLDIYNRMRSKLFEYMRPDARKWARRHFESYLMDEANFAYPPVLKHSDFGTSNILFDSGTAAIAGIIDFSSCGLGDPAYDFAGLLSSYGERFIARCTRFYPGMEAILPRVRFYSGTFALIEALFGIENGDLQAFEAGIKDYR